MATCFLFFDAIETVQIEEIWAVRLDDAGEVDIPLGLYTPENIKNMQAGAKTVVILPTSAASLHVLELPKLSVRKAREAIPYALEEELAEPVTELHIAFDRETDGAGEYRVVVVSRVRLRAWMQALQTHELSFDAITLDWFALHAGEVCATATDMLVYTDNMIGALSPLLAVKYLDTHQEGQSSFVFDDSEASLQTLDLAAHEGSYRLFVAKRLHASRYINLCQGDFQHKTHDEGRVRWYGLCGVLLFAWFVSMLGLNAFTLHALHKKQAALDVKIAKSYHLFFPEATQVISPRFRIERLLSQTDRSSQNVFWRLLDALAKSNTGNVIELEQLRYRDHVLWANVRAQDFAVLEAFEARLKAQGVHVKQTEASTRESKVSATLELRL